MSKPFFDVAIVGTGIPGLAAALGLAQQGLAVALIGPPAKLYVPTPQAPFDPRVYAVSPASVALLERLGVWASIDPQRFCPIERMRVFGDQGDELAFDAYGATVERLATIVEEAELLRGLDAACGFQPAIKRFRRSFVSFISQTDSAAISLEDGSEIQAKLLIGADGADSSVRAAAGINASIKSYEQAALVANFECAKPHQNVASQWFTDEGVVALLPLPGNRVSLVWSAPVAFVPELLALTAEHFAARVRQHCPSSGALVLIGGVYSFPLRRVTVSNLIAARIVLVGDAAHVIHPLAGQGLNLGLGDVALLLELARTRESFRDVADQVLLRRYERGRAEAVGAMRFTTDSLARLFAVDDPFVRRVRNVGMTVVNRLGPLKNALIRQALG